MTQSRCHFPRVQDRTDARIWHVLFAFFLFVARREYALIGCLPILLASASLNRDTWPDQRAEPLPEPDIDIETLRRSRAGRFMQWLSATAEEITHLHWRTANATVVACRPARISPYYLPSIYVPYDPPILTGYVVDFSYTIKGKTYTGILDSPIEGRQTISSTSAITPPTRKKTTRSAQLAIPHLARTLTTTIAVLLIAVPLLVRFLQYAAHHLPLPPVTFRQKVEQAFAARTLPTEVVPPEAYLQFDSDVEDALWFSRRDWHDLTWQNWRDRYVAITYFSPQPSPITPCLTARTQMTIPSPQTL
jgi:hypothetical protein